VTTSGDVRLTELYLTQLRRITAAGMRALIAAWEALPGIDDEDVETFTRVAVPLLAGVETAAAASSAGYFRQLIGRPATVPIRGLDIAQDLRHPFIGVYRDLKRGVPYREALNTGRDRSASLAQERVELTQNEIAGRLDSTVDVGWRRVPQGATCSWCVRVASQRYSNARAASFGHGHNGVDYCDCKKVPIYGSKDPGRVINDGLRRQWNQANKADNPPAYFDVGDDGLTAAPRP
jgi:hypothetical protein